MDLLHHLRAFLSPRLQDGKPLLLALSGGTDSLALLHLLLDYKRAYSLQFSLAHVDHGWREESQAEAQQLADMAHALGLQLHLKTLDPTKLTGNLELACRNARYQFFAALCRDHGYQALLLAHHANDQAETVLKRILEGAALPYLSAISPETELYGLKVWRPLLHLQKAELEQYLREKGVQAFDDPTNRDPRFLRSRLRENIIPSLAQQFGKEVQGNLCYLAQETAELQSYMAQTSAPYLAKLVQGKWGVYLDLSQGPHTTFELKHLIRTVCRLEGFNLSRTQLDQCIKLLFSKKANKRLEIDSKIVYIDRRTLFIERRAFNPLPKGGIELKVGRTVEFGPWKINMEVAEEQAIASSTSWREMWQGYAEAVLPKGNYRVSQGSPSTHYPSSASLGKWWTDHKIPAFFRNYMPVICQENGVRHELLTGITVQCLRNGVRHELLRGKTGDRKEIERRGSELLKIRFLLNCQLAVEDE